MIRVDKKQATAESQDGDSNFSSLPGLAKSLIANTQELRKQQEQIDILTEEKKQMELEIKDIQER